MNIVFYVKRASEYLMPGDEEKWTLDFMEAREFDSDEAAQEVARTIAGARVMAMD
ncbi:hypothetical protein PQR39_35255 [Paraburkholderia sediminicola]|uniref:hypothetical protein n=1 Tax=Paraburkholderia sediminicola TaxID=458836 RepID=UPI0038BD8620